MVHGCEPCFWLIWLLLRNQLSFSAYETHKEMWGNLDLNQGPAGYESAALTTELLPLINFFEMLAGGEWKIKV